MLNTIFFVLLGAVAGQASNLYQPDQVQELTNKLGEKIKDYALTGQGNIAMFYDDDSMLSFESSLPIGGLYEDLDDIALFYKRVGLSLKVDNFAFTVLGANEATGIGLLETKLDARLRSRNQPLELSLTNIIEWNQLTGKIKTHLIIDKHVARTLKTVATPAEKHLFHLQNEMMKTASSDIQALRDGSAPVWDLVSDNIQVKLNMFPDDIWDKNEWTGKQELIAHMEEARGKDLLLTRNLPERIEGMKSTTLFADEDEVWKKYEFPGQVIGDNDQHVLHGVILKHYMFDAQGKLMLEEITLSKALEPWQIYPLPDIYNKQSEQMGAKKSHGPFSNVVNIGDVKEFTQVGHVGMGDISKHYSKVELEFEGLSPEAFKNMQQQQQRDGDSNSMRHFQVGMKEGQFDYKLMKEGAGMEQPDSYTFMKRANLMEGQAQPDSYTSQQQQQRAHLMESDPQLVKQGFLKRANLMEGRANLMEGQAQPAAFDMKQQQQNMMHKQMHAQKP